MIGIIVPVHDEDDVLGECLDALAVAARDPGLHGEAVHIAVVLDDCTDRSSAIAAGHDIDMLVARVRNVGIARALGARRCLDLGARWLATTDADTRVAPTWLSSQLALRSDAVCGSVAVDWKADDATLQSRFQRSYRDCDGHRHVHGANFGVSADAYRRAGGFKPLKAHEDVDLVDALTTCGAHIAWSARPRVVTSARRRSKTAEGFGATLSKLAKSREPASPSTAPLAFALSPG